MPHEFTNEIEICTTQIQVCGKGSSCRMRGNYYRISIFLRLYIFLPDTTSLVRLCLRFANNPYCFIECYVGNFTCKVVRLIIFNNPFNDRRQWNFRPCVAFLWHIGQSFACSYMDNMFMYLGYFAKKAAFNVVFMISCSLRSICSLDGLLASVWLLFSWVFLSNSVLFVIMSIKPFFFHFF